MKVNTKYLIFLALIVTLATSCKKLLEPDPDNSLTEDQILANQAFAEGLLLNAYKDMPAASSFDEDVITDDAVTNDPNSDYRLMATGSWTSSSYPLAKWSRAYKEIFYINSFLEKYDQVIWDDKNSAVNELHKKRLAGEAYGLRAWWQYQLLQYHAGETPDGQMLGFPIILKTMGINDELNLPRNSFDECVDQILADCDKAIENLPDTYADHAGSADYNRAMGARWTNRMTGFAARALKASVSLFAASPAFNPENDITKWDRAARAAGELLQLNGGLAALSPTGLTWYLDNTDPEIIWSRAIVSSRGLETTNFPPSLLGNGRTNPSQQLVESFPMKNGYPIDDPLSLYTPADPYQSRDPRLAAYILYNGNSLGVKGPIETDVDAPIDGVNKQTNSTRTGYYVKKLLLDNVSLTKPAQNQNHFITYFRFTEIFLAYAEAANEAYGPNADPQGYGFTTRTILKAIRKRGGIDQPDAYLNALSGKNNFRTLIRNERRIELCFEGQRFNDLRRWKDLNTFKTSVKGVTITKAGTGFTYSYKDVESRKYQDYMIFGPIPYGETLRSDLLKQNKGW